jgi:hypothetical protein
MVLFIGALPTARHRISVGRRARRSLEQKRRRIEEPLGLQARVSRVFIGEGDLLGAVPSNDG